MKRSNGPYSDDQAKAILRRAIEIDAENEASETEASVSETDVHLIASEIDVSPSAVDRAMKEMGTSLVAEAPAIAPALRRWAFFAVTVSLAVAAAILTPETLKELAFPFGVLTVLALFSALAPRVMRSTRASMRIDLDGVRYRSGNKDQLLKWESVIQIAPGLPGAINLVTPHETVMVMLEDFGDPDAVLAVIRARVGKASGVLPPGK